MTKTKPASSDTTLPDIPDLRECDSDTLVKLLRELPVERWNEAFLKARKASDYTWIANLVGARLNRASLDEANLNGANLVGARLVGATLVGANLYRANLYEANLNEANLNRARLVGATLVGVNLNRANLYEANLNEANLDRARLVGARLNGANLVGASLDGARLNGKHAWIGEAAGYPVLLLGADNEAGHVLRAGCWTGVLDDAVERAIEEADTELCLVEADAVVAHGRVLLAAWGAS